VSWSSWTTACGCNGRRAAVRRSTPPRRSGFGTRLIERSLAAELEGSARLDYRPEGLVCTIEARVEG
jgi:two-component sensor histidine kinase